MYDLICYYRRTSGEGFAAENHLNASKIPFSSALRLLQHARFILIFFFRNNVWALCPTGYYLNGIRISAEKYLHQIEEAKCCRPNNHPDAYADCYDEDVGLSFDKKGWSQCNRAGYYMAGFWRGSCDHIYCIEKFRCCRMKSGNYFLVIPTL